MSTPHWANGQGEDMEVNSSRGLFKALTNFWHLSHGLTIAMDSWYIFGQ